MPWTGSTFIRDNSAFTGDTVWTDDRDAGTKITSSHHDFHDQDIADGITACLNRNGANSPTANINWGGFKITNQGAGVATTDSAIFGQTITAASLNAGTNVLTLTRATGGDIPVDLSALAVGGSTADFARYSNGANPFQGGATFEGTLECLYSIAMQDVLTATGPKTWTINALTSSLWQVTNLPGADFRLTGNAGAASLTINGAAVWTTASLPASTFTGMLTASSSPTITGAWIFTNPNNKFVPFFWTSAVGGGDWIVGPTSATQLDFTDPSGLSALIYVLDAAPKAGAYLQIGPNAKRAWDQGSLQSGLTVLPTGGEDNNLAVVQSGADRGLYARIAGVWTLLIAFP